MSAKTIERSRHRPCTVERLRAEYVSITTILARGRAVADAQAEIWGDDASLEIQQLEVGYRHQAALAERLRSVEEALERLGAGEYGQCQRCGCAISSRRLDADPAVAFCVSCQESVEVDFHLWSL